MKKKKKEKMHHRIPFSLILVPGSVIILSLLLLIAKHQEWAYFFLGVGIIIAILIHKED